MIPSDSLATLVGYVAAICTTGAFVPQVLRVWRLQSAQDISLTTFLVFSLGRVVWLVYGLLIDSLPVILANGVTLALALTIVALKLNFDRKVHRPPT